MIDTARQHFGAKILRLRALRSAQDDKMGGNIISEIHIYPNNSSSVPKR